MRSLVFLTLRIHHWTAECVWKFPQSLPPSKKSPIKKNGRGIPLPSDKKTRRSRPEIKNTAPWEKRTLACIDTSDFFFHLSSCYSLLQSWILWFFGDVTVERCWQPVAVHSISVVAQWLLCCSEICYLLILPILMLHKFTAACSPSGSSEEMIAEL